MIAFMRRLHLLLVLFFALLLALPLAAQPSDPAADGLAREIYTALAFGDPVFEPELWLASAAELDDRTTATWQAADFGALGYAELLHFNGGYTPNSLRAYFDDVWFTEVFDTYDQWERTGQCVHDTVIVQEFALRNDGTSYKMRYWIMPIAPTRVLAFHLIFPAGRASLLEEYSRRFAPLAWRCTPERS
jgi:hypothetical protein